MNLSLRNRVATSFIVANIVVLVLTFTVFHFLDSLNKDFESVAGKSNYIMVLTEEVRISAVYILKHQRQLLLNKNEKGLVEKIIDRCDSFTSLLHRLDSFYTDPDFKKVINRMLGYVESLKSVLGKATLFNRDSRTAIAGVSGLADKILDAFVELQDRQYYKSMERSKEVKKIINQTKRNMMTTLIIGFLGTIILGLVVPGKIALPFKKIKDAIRELQDCNFDVSIFYNQDDEIGEIAREMNKMIHSFKVFEELRADRIGVEHRKFDALANMIKKPILVADAGGRLIYMNNFLYSILQVQSEDVIGKVMGETIIPTSIIESYELAFKRRSKIENAEVVIDARQLADEEEKEGEEEREPAFSGFANVIPIRGKESSLDYYIMVMSKEVFI